eukprot:6089794-Amphidinium_carterae.1
MTLCKKFARRSDELQCRRDNTEHPVPADDPLPALPTWDDDDPWTDVKSQRRKIYKDAMRYYSSSHSCSETWQKLHVTYDQGQKAQKLQSQQRIICPTWDVNQSRHVIIRRLNNAVAFDTAT